MTNFWKVPGRVEALRKHAADGLSVAQSAKLLGAGCTRKLTHGPCWTLFVTGPRIRNWGFHCPNGWVRWEAFTPPADKGSVGRGCGESA